jgi:hypothetical protein
VTKVLLFLLCLIGTASAEPLRLRKTGCSFYAQDAAEIATLRDSGVVEKETQSKYSEMPYHPEVKPHLVNLIRYVYSSKLSPENIMKFIYVDCIENGGWIGRDT